MKLRIYILNMSGLNNKKYLDAEGLIKFWEICCANFPARDGRGASGTWAINITGNAATADEADKWSTPRNIKLTGGVTGNVDIDGSEDVEIATTVVSTAHTHNQYYDKTTTQSPNTVYAGPSSGTTAGVASFRTLVTKDIPDLSGIYLPLTGGTINTTSVEDFAVNRTDSGVPAIRFSSSNETKGFLGFDTDGNPVYINSLYNVNILLHEGNFNTYSPKLDGTGATGTWNIGITGNAATATQLANTRKLWGQDFNGTANVTGNMTGVGSLSMSGALTLTGTTAETSSIIFTREGYSYISSKNVFAIEPGGLASSGSTGYQFNSSSFYPGVTNTYSIGTSDLKWSNVYSTTFTGNLTGNVTGNLTGIASKVAVGTGTGNAYRAIVVTDGSNGLYTAGTGTGKPQYNYSTGDVKAKSFTTDGGSFNGNLAGNATTATSATTATTATNLANKPVLAASGTAQITVKAGEKTSEPFTVPYASEAGETVGTLTLSTPAETITFNGSENKTFEVTAAKLGLTKAVLYLGKSTTAITDGGTEKPTIDGSVVNTLTNGNIVIDSSDSREYIWNGSKWELFGLDGDAAAGNYKPIQTAVSSPSADGNSTSFIDTISQDANGKITATKKNVNFSGYKTTQTTVSSPSASGNDISFIDTISQNTNGVITATRKTVRSATASQSGVVTTGAQTFAGAKTFNGGIIGNLTGNADTATTATTATSATSATTATNLASAPSLAASGSNITVTAGGKTSAAFTVPYATTAGSASKLGSTSIAFTPAETALTPDDVYTLVGGTTIKRGTWSYASNGYISNDVTGVGTIDLAGTTVIQAVNGNSNYTQLYLTPSTGTSSGYKANEIFMYNNNGSNYYPSWTRVLTNRNYSDYCLPKTGGTLTGNLTAPTFIGNLTGNVTGNVSGSSGSCTGNAATATTATTVVCSAATSDNDRPIVVTNTANGLYYSTKAKLNYSTGIITATNLITTSDRRMKTNIVEIDDASKSLELGFYEFDYKSGGHSAGHIAQDVREVLPKFVHGKETETENLSVDYTGLHSIQIKALKDKVETLETENKELRERLEKLEALIEKLV